MKRITHILFIIALSLSLGGCGSSTPVKKESTHGSIVKKKTDRAANRVENRVDRKTDRAVDRAVDRVLRKIF